MRIHRDERGQTIILIALSLPILLGFIGIATDVGALFKDKRTMQTAADAAAIAGALNLPPSTGGLIPVDVVAFGQAAAAANGYTDGSNGVQVKVNVPPTWTPSNYNGVPGYVEVTITKPESTIFLALFGYPSVTVLARAVATNAGPGGGIIYTLGPTGTTLNITGSLTVLGGGIIVDSNDTNAMTVAGSVTATSTGIVGGCSSCSSTNPSPAAVSGIIPYSDPLSYLTQTAPGGSCSNILNATGGTVVLFPGCYATFNETGANVTLSPGTYVINTATNPALLTGGTLSGTGVTLFINSGNLVITGATMNLSAPTSGNLDGILFQQSNLDTNDATISGNPSSNLQGFFYFPNNTLQLTGSFGTLYTGFVAKTLNVNVPNLTINNYASLPGTTSPITSAVLVE